MKVIALAEMIPSETAVYFDDHNTLIDRTAVVLKYQLGTLLFLLSHYQDQETEVVRLRRELEYQNGVLLKAKASLENSLVWKTEYEKVRSENEALRRNLAEQFKTSINSNSVINSTSPKTMGPPMASDIRTQKSSGHASNSTLNDFDSRANISNTVSTNFSRFKSSDVSSSPASMLRRHLPYRSNTTTPLSALSGRQVPHSELSEQRHLVYTPTSVISQRNERPHTTPPKSKIQTSVASPFFKSSKRHLRETPVLPPYDYTSDNSKPGTYDVPFTETIHHVGEHKQTFPFASKRQNLIASKAVSSSLSKTSNYVSSPQNRIVQRKSFNR
ncbi:hypothetical protein V1512DRAFT_245923 [Lipomyces arxii]|uniref:uncharacterized protein n=1 Tax=Lipomyces arxii TaxID=56418 RepID=UPI0034CEDBD1